MTYTTTQLIEILEKGANEWNNFRYENNYFLCDYSGVNYICFIITKANLSNFDLSDYNLSNIYFSYCNLENTNLKNCNLSLCLFRDCNLKGADLTNVNLGYTSLNDVNLDNANLTNIHINKETKFKNVTFYGAIINNTNGLNDYDLYKIKLINKINSKYLKINKKIVNLKNIIFKKISGY